MARLEFQLYLSYSQLCIFDGALSQPFNDWSDRNVSQGFAWRVGSVSFRALTEAGNHAVNMLIDEGVPAISDSCVRAFKVPFETSGGNIEVASISDSAPLKITPGEYVLQVEFVRVIDDELKVNVRLNRGKGGFEILKADGELDATAPLDLMAQPAT